MRTLCITTLTLVSLVLIGNVSGQGFINLNFESANLTGYSPGAGNVPIGAGLPGWIGYYDQFGIDQTTYSTIYYDGSYGSENISINDTNLGNGFVPYQGQYSVNLFSLGYFGVETSISQTGLVPAGTQSLLMDAAYSYVPFVVTLGGQTINMQPLQTFSNYTVYGGDIASFANDVENLTITEPVPPSFLDTLQNPDLTLDDIQFSPQPIPEPGTLTLFSLGILFLCWRSQRPGLNMG